MKQNLPRRDDYSNSTTTNDNSNNYYREPTGWSDSNYDNNGRYFENSTEDWDLDTYDNSVNTNQSNTDSSWGGKPVSSENWDLEISEQPTRSSVSNIDISKEQNETNNSSINKSSVSKALFGPNDPPLPSSNNVNNDSSWGASLTGSSWDTPNTSIKQWDTVPTTVINKPTTTNKVEVMPNENIVSSQDKISLPKSIANTLSNSHLNKVNKPLNECLKSGSPGITSWAGLDSFDALPSSNSQNDSINIIENGGTKPKIIPADSCSSGTSDKLKLQPNIEDSVRLKDNLDNDKSLNTLDSKVDSNLKVTGWLQNSTTNEVEWVEDEKQGNDDEFGWTKVSIKTKVICSFLNHYKHSSMCFSGLPLIALSEHIFLTKKVLEDNRSLSSTMKMLERETEKVSV